MIGAGSSTRSEADPESTGLKEHFTQHFVYASGFGKALSAVLAWRPRIEASRSSPPTVVVPLLRNRFEPAGRILRSSAGTEGSGRSRP